jgi:hypothetical protein
MDLSLTHLVLKLLSLLLEHLDKAFNFNKIGKKIALTSREKLLQGKTNRPLRTV